MLRHFNSFEQSIIKDIVQNESELTELVSLLEPHLDGATMSIHYEDNESEVNIELQAYVDENTAQYHEKVTERFLGLLKLQKKMVFAANLMEYLHDQKLIYVYGIDKLNNLGMSYGFSDSRLHKNVTVRVSDNELKKLVHSFWQKRFIPNQALVDLCNNDFISTEEVRERKRNRLTAMSIGVAFMVGLGSLCFQVIDKLAQSQLNQARSKILVSELQLLNQNIHALTQRPVVDGEKLEASLVNMNQTLENFLAFDARRTEISKLPPESIIRRKDESKSSEQNHSRETIEKR